ATARGTRRGALFRHATLRRAGLRHQPGKLTPTGPGFDSGTSIYYPLDAAARRSVMELAGQAAIVTGGGRGIGRATALELARQGADIVIAELDKAGAEKTAAEVQGLGRKALVLPTDVTKPADLKAMAERTQKQFGRIDVLINNAGIYRAAASLDVTEEHWDAVLDINAKAVFFATQAVLPTMIAQKRGAIVSLASMAGKV